ncbi:hypothetical protein [Halovivax cerinus]|uniref:Geranylgeranyl pyrophosphate synthase n=1 Tax=Halovivax cerinus TaxID=1487865 RepID=A0ABD5NJ58_9EURY|nr:hypothetical protein [Halovivax cerinus]
MIDRPLDVSQDQEDAFRLHTKTLADKLETLVAEILSEIEDQTLRDQIQYVVFEPNDALTKRRYRRPVGKFQLLIEQLYLSYDDKEDTLDTLLKASILVHEYYDIVDDLIDSDIKQGSELEIVVTIELLVPLIVKYIGKLGPGAATYWSDRTIETVGSFVLELSSEPSESAYRELLERQSTLFGSMTGVCAVSTGREDETVQRASKIGRTYFCYEQLLRDYRQYERDEPSPWNAWNLLGEYEAQTLATEQRKAFQNSIAQIPPARRSLIEPLVATDVETYQASLH